MCARSPSETCKIIHLKPVYPSSFDSLGEKLKQTLSLAQHVQILLPKSKYMGQNSCSCLTRVVILQSPKTTLSNAPHIVLTLKLRYLLAAD